MSPTNLAKILKQAIPDIGNDVEQRESLGISDMRTLCSISWTLVKELCISSVTHPCTLSSYSR